MVRLRRTATAVGVLVGLLLGACTSGAEDPRSAPASDADRSERSDDLLTRTLEADEPGCSAAVGVEGDVVWAAARGIADLSTGRPLETTTTFEIGSVTKQFTATVVLLLAHEGGLSLDDPLAAWLPGLPPWGGEVTVGHAMHHVSGIPDYVVEWERAGVPWTDRRTQADALAEIAAATALHFPAGERFEYSNSNYVLLAEVVRAVEGRPLPDVARDRVFEPLGLSMRFDYAAWSPDSTDPSAARGYVRDPTTGEWGAGGVRWEANGDAGIQSTPSELVRWADNYRTGEVGGERLLDDVLRDAADTGNGERYGAGIGVTRSGTLRHDGGAPGYLTAFVISEDRRTALAVSCNGDRGPTTPVRYVATALAGVWL